MRANPVSGRACDVRARLKIISQARLFGARLNSGATCLLSSDRGPLGAFVKALVGYEGATSEDINYFLFSINFFALLNTGSCLCSCLSSNARGMGIVC